MADAMGMSSIGAAELETTGGDPLKGFLRDLMRALREINLTGLAAVVAFTLYVWGGDLIALVSSRFGLGAARESGWMQMQGPVIMLLVFLGATLLYMTGSGHYSAREIAPGARWRP